MLGMRHLKASSDAWGSYSEKSVVFDYYPDAVYIEDDYTDEENPYKLYESGDYWIEVSIDESEIQLIWLTPDKCDEYEAECMGKTQKTEEELYTDAVEHLKQFVNIEYELEYDCIDEGITQIFEIYEMRDGVQTGVGGRAAMLTDGILMGLSYENQRASESDYKNIIAGEQAYSKAFDYLSKERRDLTVTAEDYSEENTRLQVEDGKYIYVVSFTGQREDGRSVACDVVINAVNKKCFELIQRIK